MVIVEDNGATITILKHYLFQNNAKPSFVKTIAIGTLRKPASMIQKPAVGKKILQRCLQKMGGQQFRCFALLSTDTPASQSKHKALEALRSLMMMMPGSMALISFEKMVPRSSGDLQQLAWHTKEVRKKLSPVQAIER